ncbi:MAG: 5'/3'-nucleotidase SurE [Deltaproteobacteria bacterium]|nr:5'/3'-nucleotidase SurE [Deltaproteobacteria bacterium]
MRCLLVNDDGIEAPGLAALERLAGEIGEVVTVAPGRQYSACGHQTTTKEPIPVAEVAPGRFRVSGTPVDCVRLGLTALAPKPGIVLAGINPGGNLGVDLVMSGTVAAVREAALLGLPAIAFSHYLSGPPDWDLAITRLRPVLLDLLARPAAPATFWNVNLPHPPSDDPTLPVVHCAPDDRPLQIAFERNGDTYRYTGNYHARPRTPGRDVDVCFGGKIAVSRISTASPSP